MTAISKLIKAVQNGQRISAVRFRHLPDEMHTVIKNSDGKTAADYAAESMPVHEAVLAVLLQ